MAWKFSRLAHNSSEPRMALAFGAEDLAADELHEIECEVWENERRFRLWRAA